MKQMHDGWIVTYSGRKIWPLDPDTRAIAPDDIVHALANICRFTGHVRHFYSVAQHSVLAANLARVLVAERVDDPRIRRRIVLQALLHDATEAYLSDVARPVKRQEGFSLYRLAEAKLWTAIAERFGLDEVVDPLVKEIDDKLVSTEAHYLLHTLPDGWGPMHGFTAEELMMATGKADGGLLMPWFPETAKLKFRLEWDALVEG